MMTSNPLFLVSIYLFVAVLARFLKPNLLTAIWLAVTLVGSSAYLGKSHGHEIKEALYFARDLVIESPRQTFPWPPVRGAAYPDLELIDQDGNLTRLSAFKGKVILVEPVGMSCPACVSFSGGHVRGGFQGVKPQPNLESIEKYARQFGGFQLDDPRLVFVQLVLFNREMEAPAPHEIARWASHFGFHRSRNHIVLAGTEELANPHSEAIVPGFQLIDQNFVLRMDSTGYHPQDDLYSELLPLVRKLLKE